ncbi:MAG: cyclic pyranopterin monophosphate synthase MoaC [Thermoplasmata archaeon]|uniref:Cyclic pyranopterin monophosphate synthase MoaC n=1 Tax=Candidatus Sysuiplasma superficiale TaxID=2823368 RepID=A0A8J8CIS5_9ARCH|nr:cyclic pyranopterin monophosphate synthase MoaC [Candidatus Sysuiplasma superficiale]
MIDVSEKKEVQRVAVARGHITLSEKSLMAIREGSGKKGDVLTVSEIAGIAAAKRTSETIPLCHQIPLDQVHVHLDTDRDGITAECRVSAFWKTGVEMEALCGVTASLLTVWDMVKSMEKDEAGQYPFTRIDNVVVVSKMKGELN